MNIMNVRLIQGLHGTFLILLKYFSHLQEENIMLVMKIVFYELNK